MENKEDLRFYPNWLYKNIGICELLAVLDLISYCLEVEDAYIF